MTIRRQRAAVKVVVDVGGMLRSGRHEKMTSFMETLRAARLFGLSQLNSGSGTLLGLGVVVGK